ncbi:MAG: hypothetical protein WC438_05130 [Candidatus Pacearchaeota archaeon]
MGIFDFFKKKKPEESKVVNFEELSIFLSEKQKEQEQEKQIFSKNIKQLIFELTTNLREDIKTLEEINLDEKKEQERIKLIVQENLGNYIHYIQILIEDLRKLELKEPEEIIRNIHIIFNNFDKKSRLSFEKATILIGKELGKIVKDIADFSGEFKSLTENNSLIINLKIISLIQNKNNELNSINQTDLGIKEELNNIEQKTNEINKKIHDIKEDIEKIRKSKKYQSKLKKEQELESKKQELIKLIYQLKESIDFKILANFYHNNEKEMKIVKQYRDNFQEALQEDKTRLIELIEKANVDMKSILKQIEEIETKTNQIRETKIEKDEIKDLEEQMKSCGMNLIHLANEKERELKRIEKIKKDKEAVVNLIEKELKKLNVDLEF